MLEASRVTINNKTFDLNHLKGKKKTNLRRKVIIEYIESKPAGEIIKTVDFQRVGCFNTQPNAHSFVKRMIRDGIIGQYEGDRPQTYYYAVTGAVRVKKPAEVVVPEHPMTFGVQPIISSPDINSFIADMQNLGVEFTITISNKTGA